MARCAKGRPGGVRRLCARPAFHSCQGLISHWCPAANLRRHAEGQHLEAGLQIDWSALVADLGDRFPTQEALFEELARQASGDNAFPEDALERGKQIFASASVAARHICNDPKVHFLIQDSGPRTSEVMTIVPLLLNLLPSNALNDSSIALVALLIVRMGLGNFCAKAGSPRT